MRYTCLFVALAWCFPFCLLAQRTDSLAAAPLLMLKASLGELVGAQYSKVHLSAALRITPQHYIEIGGGKLTRLASALKRVHWNDFSGYTIEAGYRFYTKPLPRPRSLPVWWLAGGIAYQELEGNINGDFSRQDQAYSQRLDYDVRDQRIGGKLSTGILLVLGKHVTVDLGIGLFVFDRKWAFSELPEDVVFLKNGSRHWNYSHKPIQRTESRGSIILKVGWAFY